MKKSSLFLLISGLILSQLLVVKFNLNNGFVFHGIDFNLLPIAKYAGKSSPELYLTLRILGYIAFIIFGVMHINKIKYPSIFKSALMFSAISVVVTFFEFTSILEDINANYQGKYFKIGWLLFLLGIWIFSKIYLMKK